MFPLVRIESSAAITIDLAYARADNFTRKPVYRAGAEAFLVEEASVLLARAAELAQALGLRLLVLDAFRPAEAQWVLWNHTPDPGFLADPRRGSPHSMGAAVDLTLVDNASGQALDMGTAFDEFSPRSHHGCLEIAATAQRHRHLLMGIMTTAGWDFYRNEWWHYQLFNARARHPVLSDSVLGLNAMMPG